jgi:D-alanyl-D-alanine carboxypeptidase (penicillin-binding protein 5/6)
MNEKILVSDRAARTGGSTAFLDRTEYSVKDLLQAVAMVSANDACYALMEKVAGAEEKMVQDMNEKAQSLGLSMEFVDATGRNYNEAPMSATDLANIGRELAKHKNYLSLSSEYVKSLEHPGGRLTELANPNRLVRFYSGCDGLGTGSAAGAGYSGVFTARRGDFRLIAVVLCSPDAKSRQADAQKLLDYGFADSPAHTVNHQNFHLFPPVKRCPPACGNAITALKNFYISAQK